MIGMRERGKDAWTFESWDKCVQLSPAESQFKERSRVRGIRIMLNVLIRGT